jgi:hypothetical protein
MLTRGIANSGVGSLRKFCTFNQTKLTGDRKAALNAAPGHTANRCGAFLDGRLNL